MVEGDQAHGGCFGGAARYAGRVKTKAIAASAVVLVGLIFVVFMLCIIPHRPSQDITIRHVKSVQSANITTMTFEIKNHTANPYIFFPFEVQVRNGNGWSKFQGFDIGTIHPIPKIDPKGLASYTVDVTNLPAASVVRFSIRPQKILLGVNGFVRRAELELDRRKQGGGGGGVSLNPYDKNGQVFGLPTEAVATGEFVEAGR